MIKTNREHLNDLKKSLIYFGIIFGTLFATIFYFSPTIIHLLLEVINIDNAVALTPFEGISTQLRLSFGLSLLILMPLMFLVAYRFLGSELNNYIKKRLLMYSIPSLILGVLGILFGVFVFCPAVLYFLISNSIVEPMLSIKSIIDFVTTSSIGFAIFFQIAVIVPLLVNANVIERETLTRGRRLVFVILLGISMVMTPTDLLSTILMVIPLYGCFELGLLFSKNEREVKK